MLLAALGAGAVAGGASREWHRTSGVSVAAPSRDNDAEILNFFLLLEYVQVGLYREATAAGVLTGPLQEFADTVGRQEQRHAALLTERLGGRARERPRSNFEEAISSAERFRSAAVDLEEATVAAYVGQGGNLTRAALSAITPIVSVEARQAAWVRDLAKVSPAPRAADPARKPQDILTDLRRRGFVDG
jgi:hypothetical protein